ncbi:MAG: RluA family pseudouridine synthase [Oscillospiraceae bacterium]|nr:RluA family pseudouridine synthase [Oscillospiraceae bacterium]
MDFVVKSEYHGKTVKDFLRANIDISRNMLILLKNKSDGITVNKTRVTVRFVLSEGDILSLNYEDIDEIYNKSSVVENRNLLDLIDIIYEDDFILAANKPPGMPSHPSINHFDDTLANAVTAYFGNQNISFIYRAVNRLDKNTSGIALIAKDKITSAKLNNMMQKGDIRKTYIGALNGDVNIIYPNNRRKIGEINKSLEKLGGRFEYDEGKDLWRITAPIKRERGSIIKRVCAPDGDYAETEFKILKSCDKINASVAEIYPKTGRTHQIRLHFHAIGFALLGEDLYCEPETIDPVKSGIDRHALHAYSLEFIHPESNKKIVIKCELPNDMSDIINGI